MCTNLLGQVLFEPFIWYREHCDHISKEYVRNKYFFRFPKKMKDGGRCIEQGIFTYGNPIIVKEPGCFIETHKTQTSASGRSIESEI